MEENRPKIGIGVRVWKDGKVLFGKRTVSNGHGEYAWPGGHLEFGETFEQCAQREVREETGMEIQNVRFVVVTNEPKEDKHYVTICVDADWKSGEPVVCEPEKSENWNWYDESDLPQPLFSPIARCLEVLANNQTYFDGK